MKALDFYNRIAKESTNDFGDAGLISQKSLVGNSVLTIFRRFTTQKERLLPLKLATLRKIPYFAKKFGLSYLEYMLVNNPEIPYNLFPAKDKAEIDYFLKIMLKSAFTDGFSEVDFGGRWKRFEEVRKEVGRVLRYDPLKNVFELYGFKSVVYPDTGVFPDNYKLNIFQQRSCDICFDVGAYIGDTTFIINSSFNPGTVYAFEPDPKNFRVLHKNVMLNNMSNTVNLNQLGIGIKEGSSNFTQGGAGSRVLAEKTTNRKVVKMTTIDRFVSSRGISKVDFIKMDIEGQEFNALKGGLVTIKKDKPDLMIAIYHRGEHFFEIPFFLKKLVPKYKFRFLAFSGASPVIERFLAASTREI